MILLLPRVAPFVWQAFTPGACTLKRARAQTHNQGQNGGHQERSSRNRSSKPRSMPLHIFQIRRCTQKNNAFVNVTHKRIPRSTKKRNTIPVISFVMRTAHLSVPNPTSLKHTTPTGYNPRHHIPNPQSTPVSVTCSTTFRPTIRAMADPQLPLPTIATRSGAPPPPPPNDCCGAPPRSASRRLSQLVMDPIDICSK